MGPHPAPTTKPLRRSSFPTCCPTIPALHKLGLYTWCCNPVFKNHINIVVYTYWTTSRCIIYIIIYILYYICIYIYILYIYILYRYAPTRTLLHTFNRHNHNHNHHHHHHQQQHHHHHYHHHHIMIIIKLKVATPSEQYVDWGNNNNFIVMRVQSSPPPLNNMLIGVKASTISP